MVLIRSSLCLGRRKPKWKGLTSKQEEKLMQKIIDKPDTDIDTEPEEEVEEPRSSKKGANVDKLPFIVNDSILRSSEGHTDESSSFHSPPSFNTPPTLSLAESTKNDVIQGMEFSIVIFKICCIHFSFIFTINIQGTVELDFKNR